MALRCVDESGLRFIEGDAGEPLIIRPDDTARVLEACLSSRVKTAMLYPANLPHAFFDLSSGQAGEILDKLRRYGVRLAIVCPSGTVSFSTRFLEILAQDFGVFEKRGAALEWLARALTVGRPSSGGD
jgi:hypothetical protein